MSKKNLHKHPLFILTLVLIGAVVLLATLLIIRNLKPAQSGGVVDIKQEISKPLVQETVEQYQDPEEERRNNESKAKLDTALSGPKFAFRIPELGVTLQLPVALKDLQYTMGTRRSGEVIASLYSPSLAALDVQLAPIDTERWCNRKDGLGYIAKYDRKLADKHEWMADLFSYWDSNGSATTSGNIKDFGDSFIVYNGPQATCSSNSVVNDAQSLIVGMLYRTFKAGELSYTASE